MMRARAAIAPWAGWIGGTAGWLLASQLGADLAQLDCARAGPLTMTLIGLCGALLAIVGGLVSLRVWRRSSGSLRLIAMTGVLAAGLFLLTVLLPTIASYIIPPCHG